MIAPVEVQSLASSALTDVTNQQARLEKKLQRVENLLARVETTDKRYESKDKKRDGVLDLDDDPHTQAALKTKRSSKKKQSKRSAKTYSSDDTFETHSDDTSVSTTVQSTTPPLRPRKNKKYHSSSDETDEDTLPAAAVSEKRKRLNLIQARHKRHLDRHYNRPITHRFRPACHFSKYRLD